MTSIRLLTEEDRTAFEAHLVRHRAESGRGGDRHFMPFAPDDPDGPTALGDAALGSPLHEPGWRRWWCAIGESGLIVGQVNLRGSKLRAALHRCVLGIGIERAHRGAGLGEELMGVAIDFCRRTPTIEWLDLYVFAHNVGARRLYERLGFQEIGTFTDAFRVEGVSIDDVAMTLPVP
jgi:RimJ/RimL family protein N-acetyltransferase